MKSKASNIERLKDKYLKERVDANPDDYNPSFKPKLCQKSLEIMGISSKAKTVVARTARFIEKKKSGIS